MLLQKAIYGITNNPLPHELVGINSSQRKRHAALLFRRAGGGEIHP